MVWLCEWFGVRTSGYYAWKKRAGKQKKTGDQELLKWIRQIHRGNRKAYGSPRVYKALRRMGVVCSRRRVARVMRENGIRASVVGLYRRSPGTKAKYQQTDNLLAEVSPPTTADQQWVADFTYIKTSKDGWLYFAMVLDLYSRKIVGWSFSRDRNAEFTKASLNMALADRQPPSGLIFHTDRGIEYVADKFQATLTEAQLRSSMSGKGRCLDNATAESFFHTLKTEKVHHKRYQTGREARREILDFVDFYNTERLHSSLDYASPEEYEQQAA